jgi:hypothetical protein
MKIAIMQPYLFPYVSYFQLVNSVDEFVFYDDVNFIVKGWINKNRILLNNTDFTFTVPCLKISQNKLINEIFFEQNTKEYRNIIKSIELAYKKAPNFDQVFPLVLNILNEPINNISDLAMNSVTKISRFLELNTRFKISSVDFSITKGLPKADRLIEISKLSSGEDYINAIGGQELYDKEYFRERKINLNFIKSKEIIYSQFNNEFISGLSIIDVLMFNSIEEIKLLLDKYELV